VDSVYDILPDIARAILELLDVNFK
jgi:hypothetical protein